MVLCDISLKMQRGVSYALVGKSGTGKTTLLNIIAGFLSSDSGDVTIDGRPVSGQRAKTAFLFQELGLFPWQTVAEAVAMPLKISGAKGNTHASVSQLLGELHIENHKDKYMHELSGGEKQRVALARTLINEPDLLLMDEPTSALDAMTKESLQAMILRQQQKSGAALIFVTHDIEEAVMLGQYILILNEDGTLSMLANPLFALENPRDNLEFYDECIKIRKLMKLQS